MNGPRGYMLTRGTRLATGRNKPPTRTYRWRGIPGWDPAQAPPEPDDITAAARRATQTRRTQCGTIGGYSAHQRRLEPPCTACKDARAGYTRARRAAAAQTGNETTA